MCSFFWFVVALIRIRGRDDWADTQGRCREELSAVSAIKPYMVTAGAFSIHVYYFIIKIAYLSLSGNHEGKAAAPHVPGKWADPSFLS